jgi:signal transduction histidine kinase
MRQVDHLIRDFTEFAGPVSLDRKPLDLAEVLAASLDAVKAPCAAQGIGLTKEFSPAPWSIEGDATRLRQAFDNLLRNAIEAQPQGGSIRVAVHRNGGQLTLDFTDAGPGIPREQRQNLFDFGHSTKPGGSGIGLPLSQLIVEAHGGTLQYVDQNRSARGATFRITLPLRESST